jgi:phenylacetate-CoA ligase
MTFTPKSPTQISEDPKILGPLFEQVIITGYPPFLKRLVDDGEMQGVRWPELNVHILSGGEGFVEEWRDYLRSKLGPQSRVYSAFGAADTNIGIAFELPLTVIIRRLARRDPKLRQALFGDSERLPMLFNYNPISHVIREIGTSTQAGREIKELEVSVANPLAALPTIKYNLRDEGGVLSFTQMRRIMAEHGYDLSRLFRDEGFPVSDLMPLPFMYVFGRSDGTVAVDGADIYPETIAAAILASQKAQASVAGYRLFVAQDEEHDLHLGIRLELNPGIQPEPELERELREALMASLRGRSADYRDRLDKGLKSAELVVRLYAYGSDCFAEDHTRVKRRYVEKQ